MTFLKKNWCLMIIAVLLFLLVYTIYTSSIPLPDVVNHVDDHCSFSRKMQNVFASFAKTYFKNRKRTF